MIGTTRKLPSVLALFTVALAASPAFADAPTDAVHVVGIPYGADGVYVHTGNFYNDMPVYTLEHMNTTWSLYQRSNGHWYVDFNTPSEDWDGTVAIGPQSDLPWLGDWNDSTDAASVVDSIVIGGAAYSSSTTGTYTWNGQVYNGKPVFQHQGGGVTWSVYQRNNGRWYLDFDAVSEDWSGTVEIGPLADTPFGAAWDDPAMAVSPTAAIELSGAAYSSSTTGTYTFNGQTVYNGAPVFQRQDGSTTWSIYRRANGLWYLDFDAVSEEWSGTVEIGPDSMLPTQGVWDDPNVLLVDTATTLIPLRGRHDFGSFAGGSDCREVQFAVPFDGDDVNVQVSIDHANSPGSHEATTVWVEDVDSQGARICIRETSNFDGDHDGNLSVSYLAYRPGALIDGDRGRFEDSDGFTGNGNHCNTVSFHQTFANPPIVQATITHPDNTGSIHDAMTVWLEEVGTSSFKVCVRETADMSSGHGAYAIDWIAHEPGTWPVQGADESNIANVPAFGGTKCVGHQFANPYTDVPQVFVTADHRSAGANHDATTVWLEGLSTTGFTACVRELAMPGNPGSNGAGNHDASLRFAWTAIGNR